MKELSERQYEIAKLVAKGKTNQEIADKCFISIHTVKVHLSAIFKITGVKNRTTLAIKLKEF